MTTSVGVSWNFCLVASVPELSLSLNAYPSGEHYVTLPDDSLRTYLMQLKYCQRLLQ